MKFSVDVVLHTDEGAAPAGGGAPVPIDPATLATIRLSSSDGHTLATAHFTAPATTPAGHAVRAPTPAPQVSHWG